jgi:hypothetical protein
MKKFSLFSLLLFPFVFSYAAEKCLVPYDDGRWHIAYCMAKHNVIEDSADIPLDILPPHKGRMLLYSKYK